MKDRWNISATMVADEFIDRYMAGANGEYVKVYLYILRHKGEKMTVSRIADALNHTESDVKRALAYWEKQGVLGSEKTGKAETRAERPENIVKSQAALQEGQTAQAAATAARPVYSAAQVSRLSGDEEFSQLLYMAQKYLNKAFTPRECQVFAYLYDGLKLGVDLLEYLVEYCVQNGHTSIRYLETVAINWHEKGFRTAEEARSYAENYNRNAFQVMKAFGLGDRRPAPAEQEMMNRWYGEYGFDREMVTLACSRTISAIHNPSFQYADKILSDWKQAGIHTRQEVEALDEKRKKNRAENGSSSRSQSGARPRAKTSGNQFHNFTQRDTDYDAMVLKQLKERVELEE